ncbi:MAG: protein-disulfide reductase DsbD domain-containing protein [Janthinobacterium lividum]
MALKILATFGFLGVLASTAWPQARDKTPVVAWTFTSVPIRALQREAKFSLQVHGAIEPGWHIYALEEPAGGPMETTIGLADRDEADLLHVEQSQPIANMDASFGQRTLLFRSEAVFELQLKLKHTAPEATHLHILIRFQSCNDHVCLPPHTDSLELPVSVKR